MAPRAEGASMRARVAALLLMVGLVAPSTLAARTGRSCSCRGSRLRVGHLDGAVGLDAPVLLRPTRPQQ